MFNSCSFKPYFHEVEVATEVLDWPARKQQQVKKRQPSPSPHDEGSTSLNISSVGREVVKLEVLEEGAVGHKERESVSLVPQPPTPPPSIIRAYMKHIFEFKLLCGTVHCRFHLATYHYQPVTEEEEEEEEEEEREDSEEPVHGSLGEGDGEDKP